MCLGICIDYIFYSIHARYAIHCCEKQKSPFVISLVFADILLLQHNTVRHLHPSGDRLNSPGSQEVLEMDYLDFRHVFLGRALKLSASQQLF